MSNGFPTIFFFGVLLGAAALVLAGECGRSLAVRPPHDGGLLFVVVTPMTRRGSALGTTSSITRNTKRFSSSTNDHDPSSSIWKVFPAQQWESLCHDHGGPSRVKLIHLVRHAQGTHNVDGNYRSERNIDARLTELGIQQCQTLAARVLGADCIITSPLTRCIQTAVYSFPHLMMPMMGVPKIPFYAREAWRETVNYNCDRRRRIPEIHSEFPQVNFDAIADPDDTLWDDYRQRLGQEWETHMESAELWRVAERGRIALEDLQKRPEARIVVCTHSAFLRCILNWGQAGGVPQLMPQKLDDRKDQSNAKILEYANEQVIDDEGNLRLKIRVGMASTDLIGLMECDYERLAATSKFNSNAANHHPSYSSY